MQTEPFKEVQEKGRVSGQKTRSVKLHTKTFRYLIGCSRHKLASLLQICEKLELHIRASTKNDTSSKPHDPELVLTSGHSVVQKKWSNDVANTCPLQCQKMGSTCTHGQERAQVV